MKTIVEKLNLNKYEKLAVLNNPNPNLFATYEGQYIEELDEQKYGAIFIFVNSLADFVEATKKMVEEDHIAEGGYVFIAYPKKGNKQLDSFIHRDDIFPALDIDPDGDGYIAGSPYKFSRMVSVDDVFTAVGIKREEKKKKSNAASQRVDDYIEMIPQLKERLQQYDEAYHFFETLTEGYQKGWARHIFSAKREETREKRFEQMVKALENGEKTI
ncbi:YdeI/OmpD-associated family protein [Bacillus ndiopicus]|uniref:YdeI/OmpD-associated family protein n=1 Tax=Bacillus ndiopicus TaxID=1347368 RepID=UPI0005A784BF|nr:YdeI/OmpD-associated family protein [Bacillus ndiopicus]